MAAKGLTNFNTRYLPSSREPSSVFAELDKQSVSQPNDYVNVTAAASPNWTKVVIILAVATVSTAIVVGCIATGVVLLNGKEDNEDTAVQATSAPQATLISSSRSTDATSLATQTTTVTTTESEEALWSTWGDWTQCTATCDSGIHKRYRHCIAEDLTSCVGDSIETVICVEAACSVYGKWSTWGSWGSCDVTCGGGTQSRIRTCTKSDTSDLDCVGTNVQDKACSDWNCPDCSTTCTTGTLNTACDTCICEGTVITGKVLAQSTGNPVSNAAFYASTAPTTLLTISNSTGFFTLDETCLTTELIVARDGFVDTTISASNTYLEIHLPVLVMPYLTLVPQSKYRLSGENVTLCCEAEANPSVDHFEWFKDDNILDQDLFKNGNLLTLSDLSPENSGRYQCRANSAAGAILSPDAILTVKENSEDFCADALQQKTINLPDDCVQAATNTTTYEVGECISKKCREEDNADMGTCRDDIVSCCTTGEALLKTVQCSGYELMLLVVRSCICGPCTENSLTISGNALGIDDQSPLRFGEVWANGIFQGYTSTTGQFQFEVSRNYSTITIHLKDNYFNQFLEAIKVIEITDEMSGVLRVDIMMIRVAVPVEIDSSRENTLVAGTYSNNATTPVVQISIPANAFYYPDGSYYNGTVMASLTFLDPTNSSVLSTIPGVFQFVNEEGQTGDLASLGVFNLYFEDASGEQLVLDEVVDLYVPEELGTNVTNQDIKLWKMNSETGVWEYASSGAGTRRRRRQDTARWIGEIDWSTTSPGDWWNYDMVLRRTDYPCFFKIRLFKDRTLTEPVPNPKRRIDVDYHILRNSFLMTINDYFYDPEEDCVIGICENETAYISLYYYGNLGYETLYAGQPHTGSGTFDITDNDKVLKIQMTASEVTPFYRDETQCKVSDSNEFHLRYHYGKVTSDTFYAFEVFKPILSLGTVNINISLMTWYPKREEGYRACFMKVRLLFEEDIYFTPGQYMQLTATSYGGKNSVIDTILLGYQRLEIEDVTEPSTYCIEYKCSGTIDPDFKSAGSQNVYTNVVLTLTYPTSDIVCEVTHESKLVSVPELSNLAQAGSTTGKYEINAHVWYGDDYGIYSSTSDNNDINNARYIAERVCRSGETHNLDDDNPDTGVAVTFTCRPNCDRWWWYLLYDWC